MRKKCKVGVIGSGAISDIYLSNMIEKFDQLEVTAVASRHLEKAEKKAEKYGIRACTVDELLADAEIDMVVNLTPMGAHYELIKAALLAGKHVYTEKIITDDVEKAKELLALSEEKGLYLGSAPDTFLGAALQTARVAIDQQTLGEIHSFVISANRNNDILLSACAFLREPGAGILYDYAVYYVTALVSLLGPVARVAGITGKPYPQHRNIMPTSPQFGQMMDTPNESQVSAVLQLCNGITGTLHMDADCNGRDEAYFAIYGTKGILYLTDPNQFGGTVRFLPNSPNLHDAAKASELWNFSQYSENSRGIGPADMADAIFEGRTCRASKELALHVLEVLAGILDSEEKGEFVNISSTCERPKAMPQHPVGIRNIGHVSFHVKNMDAMLHFYMDILGMKRAFDLKVGDILKQLSESPEEEQWPRFEHMRTNADRPWITYLKLADGQFLELFHDMGNWTRTIENRHEVFGYMKLNYEVEDIEKLRDKLIAADVRLNMDIHTSLDGSRELTVHDPDGNEVQFTEYPAKDKAMIPMEKDAAHAVCSGLSYTTQVAYQVQDDRNMEQFYCRGLGLRKVMTFTYGDLAAAMADSGSCDEKTLTDMQMIGAQPWLDFIEVAPHQYIELFHTAGQPLKEDRNLTDAYGYQHLCLEVNDIHAAYNAITANGITPDTKISLGADGAYQFWLTDPDGNRLELMEYASGAKQLGDHFQR